MLLAPHRLRYQCKYGTKEQCIGKNHNRNTSHSPASSFTSYFFVKIFVESKGSFSYSQKHATRPYPNPDESSLHLHCLFPLNPYQLSSYLSGSARLPTILAAKYFCFAMSQLSLSCYMPHTSHIAGISYRDHFFARMPTFHLRNFWSTQLYACYHTLSPSCSRYKAVLRATLQLVKKCALMSC